MRIVKYDFDKAYRTSSGFHSYYVVPMTFDNGETITRYVNEEVYRKLVAIEKLKVKYGITQEEIDEVIDAEREVVEREMAEKNAGEDL